MGPRAWGSVVALSRLGAFRGPPPSWGTFALEGPPLSGVLRFQRSPFWGLSFRARRFRCLFRATRLPGGERRSSRASAAPPRRLHRCGGISFRGPAFGFRGRGPLFCAFRVWHC
ncbi:unnamed protein product [Amoebophrya sp. A120]|nr:unnamed protein product [Amoebophrya sp. A120]|eukprot:GSA120T00005410001.1